MVRKYKALLVALGLFLPGVATALGLGELTLNSYLNEPLNAEVDLLEVGELDEGQVKIRLASRTDFDLAGVERAYFLTSLNFDVEVDGKGSGRLVITSEEAVVEPYLDFLIEARWPNGRLLREYMVLLDLPVTSGPASNITATVTAPARAADTSSAGQAAPDSPAAAPYAAAAEDEPVAGAEYLVRPAETLWGIATRARPQDSTVQQTMLDIQRLNPRAFIGGNINQLKAGYVLRLPTAADISRVDLSEAVSEIAQQEQNWRENQAAMDAGARDGSVDGAADRAGMDAEEKGRLQIAGTGETSAGAGAEQPEVSANLENLDRAERDNTDLRTRIDAMEEQLLTLQHILTLKDDQIAALQAALADGSRAAPEILAEVEGTVDAVISPPEQTPATPAMPEGTEPVAAAPPEVTPAYTTELTRYDGGWLSILQEYLVPIAVVLLLLVLALAYRFRDSLKFGKGSEREADARGAVEDDDDFAGVELGDDGLIVDEFSDQSMEDGLGADRLSFNAGDEEAYAAQFESGDALAEADIYIAYGRFPQAVDLLKTAISLEPLNIEYRVKLLEAAVEMAEREEFQQQYADLQILGDAQSLQRGVELLEAVDGGEVWLEDLPQPTISQAEVDASKVAAAEAAPDAFDDADAEPLAGAALFEAADATEPLAPIEQTNADAEVEWDPTGLLDTTEAEDGSEADLDDALASLDDLADAGEDLDLDAGLELDESLELDDDLDVFTGGLDLDDSEAAEDVLDLAAGAADASDEPMDLAGAIEQDAGADLRSSHLDLDLSLEVDDTGLGAAAEAPAASEQPEDTDLGGMDLSDFAAEPAAAEEETVAEESDTGFELPDLELDDITAAEEPAEAPAEAVETDTEHLSDFASALAADADDDDVLLADLAEAGAAEDDDIFALDVEAGAEDEGLEQSLDELNTLMPGEGSDSAEEEDEEVEEELVFAADGDEISTKLDLARAYLDMGDEDGARSILEEVMHDGNDAQKQEAEDLIQSIE